MFAKFNLIAQLSETSSVIGHFGSEQNQHPTDIGLDAVRFALCLRSKCGFIKAGAHWAGDAERRGLGWLSIVSHRTGWTPKDEGFHARRPAIFNYRLSFLVVHIPHTAAR